MPNAPPKGIGRCAFHSGAGLRNKFGVDRVWDSMWWYQPSGEVVRGSEMARLPAETGNAPLAAPLRRVPE